MGDKAIRIEMRSVLEQWKKSGKTLRAFAPESGVSYWKLTYWKKRLISKTTSKISPPDLVPVRVIDAPPVADESFEVHVARDRRITVRPGFDVEELRRLIVAVEAC